MYLLKNDFYREFNLFLKYMEYQIRSCIRCVYKIKNTYVFTYNNTYVFTLLQARLDVCIKSYKLIDR